MKAEIKKDGFVHIIAETPTEAFALEAIQNRNGIEFPVVIDMSIIGPVFLNDTDRVRTGAST